MRPGPEQAEGRPLSHLPWPKKVGVEASGLDGEPLVITWGNDLGDPPVTNVVVVGGQSIGVSFGDGQVCVAEGPIRLTFLRGDCNDDGIVDIADGIWNINELFLMGPTSNCAET